MTYLIDTNVISELARTRPSGKVTRWFKATSDESLHLSVLSIGEIRRGVERLDDGTRKERLRLWLERDVPAWFQGRVLPVNTAIADRWGRLLAEVARPLPAVDGLLAATALHLGLRLVTRNVEDFRLPGLIVVNPWE